MPVLNAIVPCEDFDESQVPGILTGPAYVFGDEFGLPEDIAVLVSLAAAGERDRIWLELRTLDGTVVSRSEAGFYNVPQYHVAQVHRFIVDLRPLERLGRYNLAVVVETETVGGADVVFHQI
ncbi:MAG: hypothetical protein IT462_03445 [Planctomycetes bacterium]|nr:hypothetical protein [Planctomycetota bacterium]